MMFWFRKHKCHDLDYDVTKTSSSSRGYQELFKYIFVGRCLFDISDTTVPNLIYV
jgi:hypothetical protein